MNVQKKRGNDMRTPSENLCLVSPKTANQRYEKITIDDQLKLTKKEFSNGVFTMKMVAVKLGFDRANICRYVATLRKSNSIYFVKSGICEITKHRAGFYTTNENLAPKSNQLRIIFIESDGTK